jgi:hypothetical protein
MRELGGAGARAGLPPATALIEGPLLQRQVLLRLPAGAELPAARAGGGSCGGSEGGAAGGPRGGAAPPPAASSSGGGAAGGPRALGASDNGAAAPPGAAVVYAASWWNAAEARRCLADADLPIWTSLSAGRAELHRELLGVQAGSSPYLEEAFGAAAGGGGAPPLFWGRYYVFWRGGAPLTVIFEAFSPALEAFLGPARAP